MSLVIVLVLLTGIMLLAVSGLGGAIAAVALAGLEEQAAMAFEAAESGVVRTLRSGEAIPAMSSAWPALADPVSVSTTLRYDTRPAPWSPRAGFSLGTGGTGFTLHHGVVRADGTAGRGTLVRIEQGFTVIAPAREEAW